MQFSRLPEDYQLFLASIDLMKREFRRYIHSVYWLTFALLLASITFNLWPVLVEASELIPLFALCLMSFGFLAHSAKRSVATDFADQLHLKFRRNEFNHFIEKRTFSG